MAFVRGSLGFFMMSKKLKKNKKGCKKRERSFLPIQRTFD